MLIIQRCVFVVVLVCLLYKLCIPAEYEFWFVKDFAGKSQYKKGSCFIAQRVFSTNPSTASVYCVLHQVCMCPVPYMFQKTPTRHTLCTQPLLQKVTATSNILFSPQTMVCML